VAVEDMVYQQGFKKVAGVIKVKSREYDCHVLINKWDDWSIDDKTIARKEDFKVYEATLGTWLRLSRRAM